jgi:excisionase family DNA binding protein
MIEISPSQIYTIRDVATYFKCSTRKIHRLVAAGELRGFKIGNQRRFRGDEILQYLERQGDGIAGPLPGAAPQPDRLYSLREVAGVLQITSNQAAHLLRTNRLPGFRVGMEWRCWGRDLLKLVEEMQEYQADSENGAAEPEAEVQPPLLEPEAKQKTATGKSASRKTSGRKDDTIESVA